MEDYIADMRAEVDALFELEVLTPCDIRRLGCLEICINNAINKLDNY